MRMKNKKWQRASGQRRGETKQGKRQKKKQKRELGLGDWDWNYEYYTLNIEH
jgi:hypothetical protein